MLASCPQRDQNQLMHTESKRLISVDWLKLKKMFVGFFIFMKWPVTIIVSVYLLDDLPSELLSKVDWSITLQYLEVMIWPFVAIAGMLVVSPHLSALMARLQELDVLGNRAKFWHNQGSRDKVKDDLTKLDSSANKPTQKTNADFQVTDDETHALLSSYNAAVAFMQVYAKNIWHSNRSITLNSRQSGGS